MTIGPYVLDSSAVLAIALVEPGGEAVRAVIRSGFLSVINAAEVGDRLTSVGVKHSSIARMLYGFGATLIESNLEIAVAVSHMYLPTRRAGLSLGDRFCLALAKQMKLPALTGDRRWLDVADEIGVQVELFR